jgi:DNA-binding CsgD family transcriptional regulator
MQTEKAQQFQVNEYHFLVEGREVRLSSREYECYKGLLAGKTAKECAAELQVSIKTIEGYLANLRHKLGCSSRSELFSKALALDLIL